MGLVAAALAAVNPLLVWYSQEARVYSMLVLVSGLSFLFFIRLLTGDPRRRTLVLWAVISGIALATHYFAAFLVAIEVAWLLASRGAPAADRDRVHRPRRRRAGASPPAAPSALARPRRLHRRDPARLPGGAHAEAVPRRVRRAGRGDQRDHRRRARRARDLARHGRAAMTASGAPTLIGAVVGGTLLVTTALLAVIGVDYLDTRNVLVAWPPLALAVAAGLGARRSGQARIGGGRRARRRSARSTVVFVDRAGGLPARQLAWRRRAALGERDQPRAVVVTPFTARAAVRGLRVRSSS